MVRPLTKHYDPSQPYVIVQYHHNGNICYKVMDERPDTILCIIREADYDRRGDAKKDAMLIRDALNAYHTAQETATHA